MKLMFVPFSLASGLAAGLIAKKVFAATWKLIDDEEPPDAEHRRIDWPKAIAAMAIEGAVFSLTKGIVDHGARVWFSRWVGGAWPGEERPESG